MAELSRQRWEGSVTSTNLVALLSTQSTVKGQQKLDIWMSFCTKELSLLCPELHENGRFEKTLLWLSSLVIVWVSESKHLLSIHDDMIFLRTVIYEDSMQSFMYFAVCSTNLDAMSCTDNSIAWLLDGGPCIVRFVHLDIAKWLGVSDYGAFLQRCCANGLDSAI